MLSDSQLATLAELGDEHTADVSDVLYRVGDQRYPFIAIVEGEVAIVDASGQEIIRHGPSRFLGELNLLSGQTVFVTAVVTQPLRYIAVDRDVMRELLFDDGPLSDLVLSTFIARREALQTVEGLGLQIVGPRSSDATMRMLDFARSNRLPFTWHDELPAEGEAPLVRLPGGAELRAPSRGQVLRAIGIGRELAPREEVDLLVVGGGPAGLGAAVYGASEGLDTLVIESTVLGGQAGSSRRIENYLGFPAGITGTELASRAVTQARKFGARPATPYRAIALEPGDGRHVVRLEEDHEIAARAVILATGAEYRRLPVDGLADYEGLSVFYAAGPPEAQLCGASRAGVVGGGNSAGQAAVWLARGGALVTTGSSTCCAVPHACLRQRMRESAFAPQRSRRSSQASASCVRGQTPASVERSSEHVRAPRAGRLLRFVHGSNPRRDPALPRSGSLQEIAKARRLGWRRSRPAACRRRARARACAATPGCSRAGSAGARKPVTRPWPEPPDPSAGNARGSPAVYRV